MGTQQIAWEVSEKRSSRRKSKVKQVISIRREEDPEELALFNKKTEKTMRDLIKEKVFNDEAYRASKEDIKEFEALLKNKEYWRRGMPCTFTMGLLRAIVREEVFGYNRKISQDILALAMKEIKTGEWMLTHQGIAFDVHGRLRDGQHRILAMLLTEKPQTILVSTGWTDKECEKVDTGRFRSISDQSQLYDIPRPVETAAALRTVFCVQKGYVLNNGGTSRIEWNIKEERKLYKKYGEDLVMESIRLSEKLRKAAGKRAVRCINSACFLLFAEKDLKQARDFFDKLIHGYNLEKGSPILALRNVLSKVEDGVSTLDRPYFFAVFTLAWNHYRRGETVKSIDYEHGVDDFPNAI